MFADSLLETSWAQRSRRSLTTLTSFGLEAVVIGLLLLIPILKTVGLPASHTVSTPITLGRATPEAAPRPRTATSSAPQSNFRGIRLVAPGEVPRTISMAPDDPIQPPQEFGSGFDRIGSGAPNGLRLPIISGTRNVMPLPPQPAPNVREFRTSHMLEGNLIRRVQPVYPYTAKIAHVQGPVVLAAIISKAGTIENLRLISGHPMLVAAAVDAVSQWRYRPYVLNNEPIEVETRITVNFMLSGN